MSAQEKILAYPGLGMMAGVFSAYEIIGWPKDAVGADAFAAQAPAIRAALVIGSEGLPEGGLEALPNLGLIACFGAGYDGLDLDACKARGVAAGDRMVRSGAWAGIPAIPPPRSLSATKLGIVGMGAIGQETAARAKAFGMDIRWTGPRPKPEVAFPFEPDLLALATWADALVLAMRPDPGTERMIDATVLTALGGDGILVNVARGSVVDEDALIAALRSGALGAAGLDVFESEPTPAARWQDVPNVTLTPHLAGATRQAVMAMVQMVLANLSAFYAGQPLPTRVA